MYYEMNFSSFVFLYFCSCWNTSISLGPHIVFLEHQSLQASTMPPARLQMCLSCNFRAAATGSGGSLNFIKLKK